MPGYRELSLWFDQLGEPIQPRRALSGDTNADVAIVGAGYTGLWTAYYLLGHDPSLRVTIAEAQIAGYGASGRNGGWCSALYPVGIATLANEFGRDRAIAQYLAIRDSVREVERVAATERVDADIARGGTIVLARSAAQLHRAQAEATESSRFGLDIDLLDADAAR